MHTIYVHIVTGPKIDPLFKSLKNKAFSVGFRLRIKKSEIFITAKITSIKTSTSSDEENWTISFVQLGEPELIKFSKGIKSFFKNGNKFSSRYSTKTRQGYFGM